MNTTVFSIAPQLHTRPALICQLHDISPDAAIERLSHAGILAIAGTEPNSVVLIGFTYEVSLLVSDLKRYGTAWHLTSRIALAKLKRFSLAS
jgi:hypothetical protein